MCLSFEEKKRASEVAAELDDIGKKLMTLRKPPEGKYGELITHEKEGTIDNLRKQHDNLMKELKNFIDKC